MTTQHTLAIVFGLFLIFWFSAGIFTQWKIFKDLKIESPKIKTIIDFIVTLSIIVVFVISWPFLFLLWNVPGIDRQGIVEETIKFLREKELTILIVAIAVFSAWLFVIDLVSTGKGWTELAMLVSVIIISLLVVLFKIAESESEA